MLTNEAGRNIIKRFEGISLNAYLDAVNIWTIGYGHTNSVQAGDVISPAQAEIFLREDLRAAEFAVTAAVKVPLNENEFSALVCFVFNLGAKKFASSTLLQRLNLSDRVGAADEFLRWNKAGGNVLAGLTARRSAERDLFLRPVISGANAC